MPITVLIVQDHPIVRGALIDLFAETPDITVVGECSDGSQVTSAVATTGPDVVLMDLQMPYVDGLQATRELLVTSPRTRVVVLTGALTCASVREAQALGVAGYLLKGDDPGELPGQVRTVAAGGSAWSPFAVAIADHD